MHSLSNAKNSYSSSPLYFERYYKYLKVIKFLVAKAHMEDEENVWLYRRGAGLFCKINLLLEFQQKYTVCIKSRYNKNAAKLGIWKKLQKTLLQIL